MQIAEYTVPSLIKIAEPQRLFAEGTKLTSIEIIESIRKSCELDEVCALSVIRQMVDRGEISEELGAAASGPQKKIEAKGRKGDKVKSK